MNKKELKLYIDMKADAFYKKAKSLKTTREIYNLFKKIRIPCYIERYEDFVYSGHCRYLILDLYELLGDIAYNENIDYNYISKFKIEKEYYYDKYYKRYRTRTIIKLVKYEEVI